MLCAKLYVSKDKVVQITLGWLYKKELFDGTWIGWGEPLISTAVLFTPSHEHHCLFSCSHRANGVKLLYWNVYSLLLEINYLHFVDCRRTQDCDNDVANNAFL